MLSLLKGLSRLYAFYLGVNVFFLPLMDFRGSHKSEAKGTVPKISYSYYHYIQQRAGGSESTSSNTNQTAGSDTLPLYLSRHPSPISPSCSYVVMNHWSSSALFVSYQWCACGIVLKITIIKKHKN